MVWLKLCLYEVKNRLKHPSPYICALLIVCVVCFYLFFILGAGDSKHNSYPPQEDFYLNSSIPIFDISRISFFFILLFTAYSIYKGFKQDSRKDNSHFGIVMGNVILSIAIYLFAFIVFGLCMYLPFIDPLVVTDAPIMWYICPMVILFFPNLFISSGLLMAGLSLTHRKASVFYVVSVLALTIILFEFSGGEQILAWLDPFGFLTYWLALENLTLYQINTESVGWTPLLVYNRLIWVTVTAVVLVIAHAKAKKGGLCS